MFEKIIPTPNLDFFYFGFVHYLDKLQTTVGTYFYL